MEGLSLLGLDERFRLYWDGEALHLPLKLNWWQMLFLGLGALSTLVIAIVTVMTWLGFSPSSGSSLSSVEATRHAEYSMQAECVAEIDGQLVRLGSFNPSDASPYAGSRFEEVASMLADAESRPARRIFWSERLLQDCAKSLR